MGCNLGIMIKKQTNRNPFNNVYCKCCGFQIRSMEEQFKTTGDR